MFCVCADVWRVLQEDGTGRFKKSWEQNHALPHLPRKPAEPKENLALAQRALQPMKPTSPAQPPGHHPQSSRPPRPTSAQKGEASLRCPAFEAIAFLLLSDSDSQAEWIRGYGDSPVDSGPQVAGKPAALLQQLQGGPRGRPGGASPTTHPWHQ